MSPIGSRLLRQALVVVVSVAVLLPAAGTPTLAAGPTIDWAASISADGPLEISHIVPDGNGVIVAGTVFGATISGQTRIGDNDVFVAAMNADGTLRWVRQFGTTMADSIEGLAGAGSSLFVVGRTNGSFNGGAPRTQSTAFIARLSRAGAVLWAEEYEREWWAYFHSVAVGPNGSAIVVGQVNEREPKVQGRMIRRYSATGSVVWTRTIADGLIRDVVADDGGFTVGGTAKSSATASRRSPWVARYSFAGAQQWSRYVDGVNPDTGEPMELNGSIESLAVGNSGILAAGEGNVPAGGLPPGSSAKTFARLYQHGGSHTWTVPTWAAGAAGECGGFLIAGVFQGSDKYFGGRAVALGPSGAERWRFEQAGSSISGEWVYRDITRVGSRVFVVREHRTYDPTRAVHDVIALSNVPEPVGCSVTTPTVTAPQQVLAPVGTIASRKGVPMLLTWSGAGGRAGTVRYQVRRSINGGTWKTVATGLTEVTLVRRVKPGRSFRFGVRAVDGDGRTSPWADGQSFFVGAHQERSANVAYGGSWTQLQGTNYFGGYIRYATQAGATARTTVNARAVGWIASRGPDRGAARVYIDGVLVETVDLHAPTTQHRVLVFSRSWNSTGARAIRIEVAPPAPFGRSRVDLDAFVFWR